MEETKLVNGRYYPLWQQFVDDKVKWIGGTLRDEGDSSDPYLQLMCDFPMDTEIIDIHIEPNGDESAFFEIVGKDFSCGFDVQHGGVSGKQTEGWLTFLGYRDHIFRIKEKE